MLPLNTKAGGNPWNVQDPRKKLSSTETEKNTKTLFVVSFSNKILVEVNKRHSYLTVTIGLVQGKLCVITTCPGYKNVPMNSFTPTEVLQAQTIIASSDLLMHLNKLLVDTSAPFVCFTMKFKNGSFALNFMPSLNLDVLKTFLQNIKRDIFDIRAIFDLNKKVMTERLGFANVSDAFPESSEVAQMFTHSCAIAPTLNVDNFPPLGVTTISDETTNGDIVFDGENLVAVERRVVVTDLKIIICKIDDTVAENVKVFKNGTLVPVAMMNKKLAYWDNGWHVITKDTPGLTFERIWPDLI